MPSNFNDKWEGRAAAQKQEMDIASDTDMTMDYDVKMFDPRVKTRLTDSYLSFIGRLDSHDRAIYDSPVECFVGNDVGKVAFFDMVFTVLGYERRVVVVALAGQNFIVVKSCRCTHQMPFAYKCGSVARFLHKFRHGRCW